MSLVNVTASKRKLEHLHTRVVKQVVVQLNYTSQAWIFSSNNTVCRHIPGMLVGIYQSKVFQQTRLKIPSNSHHWMTWADNSPLIHFCSTLVRVSDIGAPCSYGIWQDQISWWHLYIANLFPWKWKMYISMNRAMYFGMYMYV